MTDKDEVVNFDLDIPDPEDLEPRCFSMFDFNRIDLVEDFSANYVLQVGKHTEGFIKMCNRKTTDRLKL